MGPQNLIEIPSSKAYFRIHMHDIFFLSLGPFFPTHVFHGEYKLEKIFLEPLTQITGVPEGDAAGEIFINQGSTINITCIVRNLPEKSSMFWTHNNNVRVCYILWFDRSERKTKIFCFKAKVCSGCWWLRGEPLIGIYRTAVFINDDGMLCEKI